MNAELIRRIRAIEEELKKSRTKERTFSRRGFDVTLASDAFSVNHHSLYFLSPETSTTDDLSTINAGADGRLIYLALKNSGDTITVKDGIGNIFLGSDRVLDSQEDVLPLLFNRELDGWVEFAVSAGSGSGGFKQYATYVIAANDSTADSKAGADYVCDGVADEEQINIALANREYARVLLLEGTFVIDDEILMQANTVLEGQGDATVLQVSHTVEILIGANNIQVKNLRVDGNDVGHINTFRFGTFTNVTLENIWFYNLTNSRTISHYGGGSDLQIINCRFDDNNSSQAIIDLYASDVVTFRRLLVGGCLFTNVPTSVIAINVEGDEAPSSSILPVPDEMRLQEVVVTDNSFDGSGRFFDADYVSKVVVADNQIKGGGTTIRWSDCFDVTIVGNNIVSANVGILGSNLYFADEGGGSRFYSIVGNTVRECSQCIALVGPPNSTGDGTRETEDYRAFAVVVGNTLTNAASGHLSLQAVSRVAVIGNTITTFDYAGTGTAGIEIDQAWEILVSGNMITENLRAMLITNSEAIMIVSNSFIANNRDTEDDVFGVEIHSGCSDINIIGNYFYNDGVLFSNFGVASSALIKDNVFVEGGIFNSHASAGPNILAWDNVVADISHNLLSPLSPPIRVRGNYISAWGKYQDNLRGGQESFFVIGSITPHSEIIESVNTSQYGEHISSWWRIIADPTESNSSNLVGVHNDITDRLNPGDAFIWSPSPGDTITVKATNFQLENDEDFVMDNEHDRITMHWTGSAFVELSRNKATTGGGSYTDEEAQDAVGTILTDTATVDFTYDDATPQITADVKDDSISNAKLANMAETTIKGRASGAGAGDPTDLSANQVLDIVKTVDGSGSGLDADLLDGIDSTGFALASHTHTASQVTDFNEAAQDAVGGILQDTTSIDFTYDDTGNIISAVVLPAGVDHNSLANLNTGDPHTQYVLLAGRSTPQQIAFGTGSGATAGYLTSTSHTTKGRYGLNAAGTMVVDEANGRIGLGTVSPEVALHVEGATPVIMLRRTNNDNAAYVVFKNSGTSEIWRIGHRSGSADNNLYLDREAGAGHIVLGLGTTSGANVGIGALVPSSSLHVTAPAISGAESIARFDVSDDTSFLRIENVTGAANAFIPSVTTYQSSTLIARFDLSRIETDVGTNPVYVFDGRTAAGAAITTRPLADWRNFGSSRMLLTASGQLGIGVASPQGKLHAHDGTGGFGHFTKTGIVGSAQTIIPDGAGDVTKGGTIIGSASTTDGAINVNLSHAILNGANTDITPGGGGDTLRFSVAANGSLTVVRQAGTKTWEISIWVVWR